MTGFCVTLFLAAAAFGAFGLDDAWPRLPWSQSLAIGALVAAAYFAGRRDAGGGAV